VAVFSVLSGTGIDSNNDTIGGVQLVAADTNGDRQPDFAINVTSDHALTAADFVL
jgi:hypothetical protein